MFAYLRAREAKTSDEAPQYVFVFPSPRANSPRIRNVFLLKCQAIVMEITAPPGQVLLVAYLIVARRAVSLISAVQWLLLLCIYGH